MSKLASSSLVVGLLLVAGAWRLDASAAERTPLGVIISGELEVEHGALCQYEAQGTGGTGSYGYGNWYLGNNPTPVGSGQIVQVQIPSSGTHISLSVEVYDEQDQSGGFVILDMSGPGNPCM